MLTSHTGFAWDWDLACFGNGTAFDTAAPVGFGLEDEDDLQQLPPPDEQAHAIVVGRQVRGWFDTRDDGCGLGWIVVG